MSLPSTCASTKTPADTVALNATTPQVSAQRTTEPKRDARMQRERTGDNQSADIVGTGEIRDVARHSRPPSRNASVPSLRPLLPPAARVQPQQHVSWPKTRLAIATAAGACLTGAHYGSAAISLALLGPVAQSLYLGAGAMSPLIALGVMTPLVLATGLGCAWMHRREGQQLRTSVKEAWSSWRRESVFAGIAQAQGLRQRAPRRVALYGAGGALLWTAGAAPLAGVVLAAACLHATSYLLLPRL